MTVRGLPRNKIIIFVGSRTAPKQTSVSRTLSSGLCLPGVVVDDAEGTPIEDNDETSDGVDGLAIGARNGRRRFGVDSDGRGLETAIGQDRQLRRCEIYQDL